MSSGCTDIFNQCSGVRGLHRLDQVNHTYRITSLVDIAHSLVYPSLAYVCRLSVTRRRSITTRHG